MLASARPGVQSGEWSLPGRGPRTHRSMHAGQLSALSPFLNLWALVAFQVRAVPGAHFTSGGAFARCSCPFRIERRAWREVGIDFVVIGPESAATRGTRV